ncbi:MAG: sensor histidine kinase [Candidatus Pelethousia sp.]|nr:sensor histidine kinase [Candidatus Pelethousia sp.]
MRNKRPPAVDLFAYIGYRRVLFLYALASGALAFLFLALSGETPQDDIRYVLLLLVVSLILVVLPDFICFRRKLAALAQVLEELNGFEQALPEGADAMERMYREIAGGFRARAEEEKAAILGAHHASQAYFTQWMHQIKTPLAAIRLLMDAPQIDKALLARQLFEVERYAELALQYVRSEDMAADLILSRTPLDPMVRACVKKYAPLFIGKGLSAQVAPLALAPITDGKWFAFLFEQLLSNAVKYTETGGVRVYLRDRTLVLEDTGEGIRPEDMARVFEYGYTGQNGRLDKRATGIGLYLARRAAEALGILLALESTPGKGTRAMLTFPSNPPGFE